MYGILVLCVGYYSWNMFQYSACGCRLIGSVGAVAPAGMPKADLWPMFPHGGKLFFRKSTNKYGMSTFGLKTKVVCTEILHMLVPKPSHGDLYLTISRPSIISPISSQSPFWDLLYKPVARRGNGLNVSAPFWTFSKNPEWNFGFFVFFL